MAYDDGVAERIREQLTDHPNVEERKMFGGIAFMVAGNMCCGVIDDMLMVRVGHEQYAASLEEQYAREMNFTGKPLRGFVYVEPAGFEKDIALQNWIERALDFVTSLPPK